MSRLLVPWACAAACVLLSGVLVVRSVWRVVRMVLGRVLGWLLLWFVLVANVLARKPDGTCCCGIGGS